MCPSYRATGDEKHSTRGRAHLLWEMLAGSLQAEGFQSEAVHEALDLCLSCKACKTECPVQVDMAAYKAEFLAQHYKGRLHPLRHYVFGFADKLARLGSIAPGITNAHSDRRDHQPDHQAHRGCGAAARTCPSLRAQLSSSLRRRERCDRRNTGAVNHAAAGHSCASVAGYVEQLLPSADAGRCGDRAQRSGLSVETPKGHICCGRPLYDFGFLDHARAYLARVLDRMAPQIEAGMPFIFLEPSCASVFKDELLEFFPKDARAHRMSKQVWLLADWLAAEAPDWVPRRLEDAHVWCMGIAITRRCSAARRTRLRC